MTDPITPEDDALAADLREFFRSGGQASEAARATAKDLFGLRRLDDELAALDEHDELARPLDPEVVGVRGSGDGLIFRFDDLVVLASTEPGRLHMAVRSETPVTVTIEPPAGGAPIPLDAAGGASVDAAGVVRLRIRRDGKPDAVTDPIAVPPA